MQSTYQYRTYPFQPAPEQKDKKTIRHTVVIIGAGPTGLTAALDLARSGIACVVLDAKSKVSDGSRAICFAKRSLEIFDRLNVVAPFREKGVTWNTGKLFFKDKEVYSFDLLPQDGHAHPAFVNLQQYYAEQYLVEALENIPHVDLRWQHKLIDMNAYDDHMHLKVETPAGVYETEAIWVIAADGAKSAARHLLGLDYSGVVFEEKFLITDVVMKADFPPERWFWFSPPFSTGQSALLHMQPDNVWRIDMQLGRDADEDQEKQPERVRERIRRMLGPEVDFDIEWISIYRFHSRRLDRFVHGRVIFVGDSAHIMSPFGARGANSGIQDADNLIWKLGLVINNDAPETLLDTYDSERTYAARENLLYTESSTKFIAPSSSGTLALRDAVLELAEDYPFARPLINSGRLSSATIVPDSPLNTPDEAVFDTALIPGAPALDAVVEYQGNIDYLLHHIGGDFTLLYYGDSPPNTVTSISALRYKFVWVKPESTITDTPDQANSLVDLQGHVSVRYDMKTGSCYLLRPDQYICARWREYNAPKIEDAIRRACGQQTSTMER